MSGESEQITQMTLTVCAATVVHVYYFFYLLFVFYFPLNRILTVTCMLSWAFTIF